MEIYLIPQSFKLTGNKRVKSYLLVKIIIIIVSYIDLQFAYPKSTGDEIRRFLLEKSCNPVMFSREDITKADNALKLTRK